MSAGAGVSKRGVRASAAKGDSEAVRQNILDMALEEFANYGFEGTRIESITERTHTSKRMIYYHFESKAGLYAAVLEYAYRKIRIPDATRSRQQGQPPLEALRMHTGNVFDRFIRFPDFVRLTLQENLQGSKFVRESPEIVQMSRNFIEALETIVREGQAAKVMRKDIEPVDVYLTMVGLCSYNVSSRPSYEVIFGQSFSSRKFIERRRVAVCDAVERYVRA